MYGLSLSLFPFIPFPRIFRLLSSYPFHLSICMFCICSSDRLCSWDSPTLSSDHGSELAMFVIDTPDQLEVFDTLDEQPATAMRAY